jgi:hypothetical protein
MEQAKDIIDRLGGPTKVARLLGILTKPGAVQRVSNWRTRGIPARVLLDHADVLANAIPPSGSELATQEAEHA